MFSLSFTKHFIILSTFLVSLILSTCFDTRVYLQREKKQFLSLKISFVCWIVEITFAYICLVLQMNRNFILRAWAYFSFILKLISLNCYFCCLLKFKQSNILCFFLIVRMSLTYAISSVDWIKCWKKASKVLCMMFWWSSV